MFPASKKSGISIIEILVVVLIIGIALGALVALANLSLLGALEAKKTIQAESLARGTIEACRNFRDTSNWNNNGLGTLSNDIPYHFEKTGSGPYQWQLTLGESEVSGFSVQLIFNDVFRDSNDNIAEQGGVLDPDTKKATVIVSWQERTRNHQIALFTYFTNWQ